MCTSYEVATKKTNVIVERQEASGFILAPNYDRIHFGNGQMIYHYIRPFIRSNGQAFYKHPQYIMQNIFFGKGDRLYVTYATGDRTKYGYIYEYDQKGRIVSKSKKLIFGHGQAIDYYKGYIYAIADIRTEKYYRLYKYRASDYKLIKTYKLPTNSKPSTLHTVNEKTIRVGTSDRVNKRYRFYDLTLNKKKTAYEVKDWGKVKFTKKGSIVGKSVKNASNPPIQGYDYYKGKHYILSDGEYLVYNENTKKTSMYKIKTPRESEGIAFDSKGNMYMGFNMHNQVYSTGVKAKSKKRTEIPY